MKILMEKRKAGIYAQWFVVVGYVHGRKTYFLIYPNQAKNYAQAVRFWKEEWGHREGYEAILLKNAEPIPDSMCLAA